jgi:hypothetical protein
MPIWMAPRLPPPLKTNAVLPPFWAMTSAPNLTNLMRLAAEGSAPAGAHGKPLVAAL